MTLKSQTSRENGKLGVRPTGSLKKPKISDFITEKEFAQIMLKAKEIALTGDKDMIKFVGEQYMGKAAQSIDHTTGGKELPTPIYGSQSQEK